MDSREGFWENQVELAVLPVVYLDLHTVFIVFVTCCSYVCNTFYILSINCFLNLVTVSLDSFFLHTLDCSLYCDEPLIEY